MRSAKGAAISLLPAMPEEGAGAGSWVGGKLPQLIVTRNRHQAESLLLRISELPQPDDL